MQLLKLRDRVLMLPALEKRMTLICDQVKRAEDEVYHLLWQYEQESRDVERIQKETISSFLLKLVGKYDDKLEKEQREEIEAKIAYDRAATRLDSLLREKEELASRIFDLRREERTYQDMLADKRRELAEHIEGSKNELRIELEDQRNAIVSQITEIKEALRAAARAKSAAEAALKSLKSAEGWATYDAITRGGIISHVAKYSHIDSAERNFHVLSSQLRELKTELKDVRGLSTSGLNEISSGQRVVDFWFDNIFTDLSVRGQIKNNASEVRQLLGSISSVESALNSKLSEAEAELARNWQREEELLLSL